MMAGVAAIVLLALACSQVLAENIPVSYIEDVIKEQGESADSRILSGWEARPGQHPHQVNLRMVNSEGGVTSCGGSVVHREWVITAAHCTAVSVTLVVRAGVTHMTRPEYISETTEYYNYPTFDSFNPGLVQPDDIAIVRLQRRLVYSDLLKSIRIQPTTDSFRNYDGDVVVTSGFGRTWTNGASSESLNWVYLTMVSNPRCASTFGAIITGNTACAQYYNVTSQSVCQGDSGGPLVHVGSDNIPTLVGVTSFVAGGSFGCHSGLPAGFIRPGPFHGWFQSITGIDFNNLNEEEDTTLAPTTTTEAPTTTEPPTTPEPETEESEEDSSSEEEDPEMADLLKRLEVLVKVKVRMNKFKKKHESHIVKGY